MFWVRTTVLALALVGFSLLVSGLLPRRAPSPVPAAAHPCLTDPSFHATVAAVNAEFRDQWQQSGLRPAGPAAAETLRRRVSLALAGTIPSFEEHQQWVDRGDPAVRSQLWVDYVLNDRRSSDYLAERFARAFVGTEAG